MVIENSGNLYWLQVKKQKEQYVLNLPTELRKGKYPLKFRLKDISADKQQEVKVGIKEALIDEDGFVLADYVSVGW